MSVQACFVFPFDPNGRKVGGVETFIRGFWRHMPADWQVRHVGISERGTDTAVREWRRVDVEDRDISTFSLFEVTDENRKSLIPVSLKFALHLSQWGQALPSRCVCIFNRIEPVLAVRRHVCPKIGFVHNDIAAQLRKGSDYYWRYAPWLYRRIERVAFGEFSKIYTVNGRTLDLYHRVYQDRKKDIMFLPTWVDGRIFFPRNEDRHLTRDTLAKFLSIPTSNEPWVIFSGRLQDQKDPLLLVEVFAHYRRLKNVGILVIVGEGNLRAEVERRIGVLGIGDSVVFVGFLEQKELARLLWAADLLLLTSRYEGMPRSVLESLGCGTPVVSTRAGEVDLVVRTGENGEIVEERSASVIAAAVDRVLSTPRAFMEKACVNSIEDYRPGKVLEGVYATVERLYSERSGS